MEYLVLTVSTSPLTNFHGIGSERSASPSSLLRSFAFDFPRVLHVIATMQPFAFYSFFFFILILQPSTTGTYLVVVRTGSRSRVRRGSVARNTRSFLLALLATNANTATFQNIKPRKVFADPARSVKKSSRGSARASRHVNRTMIDRCYILVKRNLECARNALSRVLRSSALTDVPRHGPAQASCVLRSLILRRSASVGVCQQSLHHTIQHKFPTVLTTAISSDPEPGHAITCSSSALISCPAKHIGEVTSRRAGCKSPAFSTVRSLGRAGD